MRYIVFALFTIIFSGSWSAYAQEFPLISEEEFLNTRSGQRDAWENIQDGNDFFIQDTKGTYLKALDKYLQANEYNPNNAKLNYLIGICYMKTAQKSLAAGFMEKAYRLNPHVTFDVVFWLAWAYHLNSDFDKAIKSYKTYYEDLSPAELRTTGKLIEKKIAECKSGIELTTSPVRVFIDNLGADVNTAYSEYSPVISADEEVMLYTSRRPETLGEKIDPNDLLFFEDIYMAFKSKNKWVASVNMGKPVNTKKHDACVSLSPDGQSLFIFRSSSGGNLYECILQGDEWLDPAPLPKVINSSMHETSAALTPDGKKVYFIRQKEGTETTEGDKDIFVSVFNSITQKWEEGQNLGKVINTPYNEDGIFVHPDGKTIYFSSEGHNSMGGYDIFYSKMDDKGRWSKPQNLGSPINTPDDDLFFVLSSDGKRGYYSSTKPGGFGDADLYQITFLNPELLVQSNEDNLIAAISSPMALSNIESSVELKKIRLTIVKGLVTEAMSNNPIEAQIEVTDNEKNEIVFRNVSNSKTGKYLLTLPSGKNYGIAIKADGYLWHSENFNIPFASEYQVVEKNISLLSLDIGSKIVLKNVFFESGKSVLKFESFPELEQIANLLEIYQNLVIEISGHTDNVGTTAVNQTLSTNRAKAVVDYLVSKGVPANRLQYKGYGFTKPIAGNDTEEHRALNRRVEFTIIQN